MNKSILIKHGIFSYVGGCYQLTIEYPHNEIVGYDKLGRAIKTVRLKKQTFYGIFKYQAVQAARKYLACEQYEAQHQIKNHVLIRIY